MNLNDTSRILQGAIPAAILALLVESGFTLLERVIVPRGLRLKPIDSFQYGLNRRPRTSYAGRSIFRVSSAQH